MKNLKSTLAIAFALVMLVSVSSQAASTDKVVAKAREMVKDASPDDWQTLASAAALCIKKEVNLTEAKSWFEKSLSIKENSKAFEVAGDYYAQNNLYDKAIEHYVKSMLEAKKNNVNANTESIESKIVTAKKAKNS